MLLAMALLPALLSQGIKGKIQDSDGKPVPYAAIFIKELTRGTTCNAKGDFSFPLPRGTYTIFFRSLGYTEVSRTVEVGDSFTELLIQLPPQTYMIPEVRISASGEDPAYWIMRKAIGLANYHLHEVASYTAEIYIKGTAYIENLPRAIARRIEVSDIRVKENEAYMLESLNEVHFTAPDRYEMNVMASQNTLPGYTQNVNPMDYINASLYQQQIEGVVSPLARNAFTYYRFSFEGTFLEGNHVVNKIRVIPKRKSQQLVEGHLYIVEDLWCLHSSDLSVHTIAGTLYLEQLYANVILDAWMPVNHKILADINIAGVEGSVTYVSSLEYQDVTLNPNLPDTYFTAVEGPGEEEDLPEEEEPSREQQKINELLQKEELTNRDMNRLSRLMEKEADKSLEADSGDIFNQTGTTFTVERNAVRNDSLYWNKVRPIPLTPEEKVTLQERDSILGTMITLPGNDSVPVTYGKRRNRFTWKGFLMGKTYRAGRGRFEFVHGGLLDLETLGFNTVDGLYYGQDFRLNWRPDTIHTLRSHLQAGFAFHRTAPRLTWNTELLYAPMARGKLGLYTDYTSSDFNDASGIPEMTNLVYTLLLRENYLKMYEQAEATLYNRIDLANGLTMTTSGTFGIQRRLVSHSDFSLFYSREKEFTPNHPPEIPEDDPSLNNLRNLSLNIQLEYTPRSFFVIRNYRKQMTGSNWPAFYVSYRHAIPVQPGNWNEYQLLNGGLTHRFDAGLLSELEWNLDGGYFLNARSVHFSDFKHFKSSPLLIDMAGFDHGLLLMDFYEASTAEYWASGEAVLTSSYLLLKFLPWFSERLWKESLRIYYVYTPATPHYVQAGYSLNELFFLMDVGVFAAFQGGEYKGFGVRLNLRF